MPESREEGDDERRMTAEPTASRGETDRDVAARRGPRALGCTFEHAVGARVACELREMLRRGDSAHAASDGQCPHPLALRVTIADTTRILGVFDARVGLPVVAEDSTDVEVDVEATGLTPLEGARFTVAKSQLIDCKDQKP